MLNKVCYCSITSDYISDNTLQCDSEHTLQMRVRLSAISNFTTSQLLSILQNWITNTSEIIVDGQVLTVTSVYLMAINTTPVLTSPTPNDTTTIFISPSPSDTTPGLTSPTPNDTTTIFISPSPSDTTPVLTSDSPNQTSNIETNTKNKVILFGVIGSAGGLSLFLCVCCIIISVCIFMKFKSKRNDHLKARLVIYVTSSNNDVITMYTENMKSQKEKII